MDERGRREYGQIKKRPHSRQKVRSLEGRLFGFISYVVNKVVKCRKVYENKDLNLTLNAYMHIRVCIDTVY